MTQKSRRQPSVESDRLAEIEARLAKLEKAIRLGEAGARALYRE